MKNILGVMAAASVMLVAAGPAYADSQQALVDRYSTLAGALVNVQATNQSMSLKDYLSTSKATVYSMPEAPRISRLSILQAPGADAILSTRLSASSLPELNSQLISQGMGFSMADYKDVASLAAAVKDKAGSVDAQVTGVGAQWAASLSTLVANPLIAPGSPDAPEVPQVPAGALGFGLLLDKSLTQMALDSPKLFSQVQSSGVGTASANTAWNKALGTAWANSSQDLTSVLPDQCAGGLLSVVATGDASSANKFADCGMGCKAAGQYLHSQVSNMFTGPSEGNSLKPEQGLTYTGNMTQSQLETTLPGALVADVLDPSNSEVYAQNLDNMIISSQPVCDVASVTAQKAMANTLPSVWGSLNVP